MAVIPRTLGQGGAHMTAGGSGDPGIYEILRDIATDLHTLNATSSGATSPITAPALAAFSSPPTPAELDALRTLVNQIRAHLTGGGSAGPGGALLTALPL